MLPHLAPTPSDILFACALPAPQGEEFPSHLLENPPHLTNWLSEARRHGVAVSVASNLLRWAEPMKLPAAELEQASKEIRRGAIHDALRWEQSCRECIEHLASAKLSTPLLLKGGSLRYQCYPGPWWRPSDDVDLLLPAGEIPVASRILERMGFVPLTPHKTRPWSNLHGHQRAFIRKGFVVELHHSPDNLDRPALRYEALAPGATKESFVGALHLAPSLEVQLMWAVIHSWKHGMVLPLRNLVDVHLLASHPEVDLTRVLEQCTQERLSGALAILLNASTMLAPLPGRLPTVSRKATAFEHLLNPLPSSLQNHWMDRLMHFATLWATSDGALPTLQASAGFANRRLRDWLHFAG